MATIYDVAKEVGVSIGVVSAVLHGKKGPIRYSPKTAKAVLKAAEKLNYTQNLAMGYLRGRKTYSVGVMVFDLRDFYCTSILAGMEKVLIDTPYSLLLSDTVRHEERVEEYIRLFRQKRVDGILIVGCTDATIEVVSGQANRNMIPIIIVGTDVSHNGISSVLADQMSGAYDAVQHLIKLGHKHIAGIFDNITVRDSNERMTGMRKAMEENGLEFNSRLMHILDSYMNPFEAGYSGMQSLLKLKEPLTAVFASGDSFAVGAIQALCEAGKLVPKDVSVVGFDDVDFAEYYNPPLTTVAQPLEQMGERTTKLFLEIMESDAPFSSRLGHRIALGTRLIVRKSTCQPSVAQASSL